MAIRRLFLFVAMMGLLAHGQDFDRPCTLDFLSSDDATVGPNFSLKVSFHGKPVVGARIILNKAINMHGDEVAAMAKTDSSGVARFRVIPKGNYYLDSIHGLLFPTMSMLIKVEPGHSYREKVEVE